MKIKFTSGDKPEMVSVAVKNDESTALEQGELVCYVMDGTDDGLAVCRPSSSTAAKISSFFAGVISDRAPADGAKMGMAQNFGFCRRARILRMTRAASSDAWASYPAWALGDRLVVESTNNAFSRSDAGAQTVIQGYVVAAETLASATTQASSVSGSATAITAWGKVFLRAL